VLANKKLGFVGGGNMAEALVKGLITSSFIEAKNIFVSDLIPERLEYLHKAYNVRITEDNRELVQKSDILVLAVKPQIVRNVLESFADLVGDNKLIISVAAGVSINLIENTLDAESKKKISVVRTMPNTPALVQEGVTAICGGDCVAKMDMEVAHHILATQSPPQIAVTPSCTNAGVLGMVRTTEIFFLLSASKVFSIRFIDTPAATEIISLLSPTKSAKLSNTFLTICGLTARTNMSLF
jgi:predicted dinucleotide-utilizing enzyme